MKLLKGENVTIEEVVQYPHLLITHPEFDKAIDILATLEELYEKP